MLYHHLSRHHLATDDMDKVESRRQIAHVDGALAINAEATYSNTLGIDDVYAGLTLFIIRGDGHVVSRRVGRDGHLEGLFIHIRLFWNFHQDVGVVAISDQLT